MKKISIIFSICLLISVLFVSGCIGQSSNDINSSKNETQTQKSVVIIGPNGFGPSIINISKGSTVVWVNAGDGQHWIATDMHPRNTVYPGVKYSDGRSYEGSLGCIAAGQRKEGAFDSCRELSGGEVFEFTFDFVGKWGYHDHLNPDLKGTVIVIE